MRAFGANEQMGAAHFITAGYNEGRTTTFDGLAYIAQYTDLMKAFGANSDLGATHYIAAGFSEGRSTAFNVSAYENAHPDLAGKYASNDAFLTAYINTYNATGKFLT
jgi:serralysin